MNFVKIFKCEAAAHVCDKSQYKESSLWERIVMKLHHLICHACREHSNENTKLTKAIETANIQILTADKKEAIRETIQQEISK